jgi:hypothetical protein
MSSCSTIRFAIDDLIPLSRILPASDRSCDPRRPVRN